MTNPFEGEHRYGLFPSPNDSPRDGSIHEIGIRQLAAWERIAVDWPTVNTDDGYIRCRMCTQAIYRNLDPHGMGYGYSNDQILALIVAHIRQNHSEMERLIQDELDQKAG